MTEQLYKQLYRHKVTKFSLSFVLGMIVLSGCGFKARGSLYEELAGTSVVLSSSQPYGPLERAIRSKLSNQAISINEFVNTSSQINRLVIQQINTRNKTLSVDATGRPAEYLIEIEVNLAFGYENKESLSPEHFSASRDYLYDKNNTLAHDRELEVIVSEMYDDLAGRIVNQYLIHLSKNLKNT